MPGYVKISVQIDHIFALIDRILGTFEGFHIDQKGNRVGIRQIMASIVSVHGNSGTCSSGQFLAVAKARICSSKYSMVKFIGISIG